MFDCEEFEEAYQRALAGGNDEHRQRRRVDRNKAIHGLASDTGRSPRSFTTMTR
jgi:hypothetical protein